MSTEDDDGALPIEQVVDSTTAKLMLLHGQVSSMRRRQDGHEAALSIAVAQLERSAQLFANTTLQIEHLVKLTSMLEKKVELLTGEIQDYRVRRARESGQRELVRGFMNKVGWKALIAAGGVGAGFLWHWLIR